MTATRDAISATRCTQTFARRLASLAAAKHGAEAHRVLECLGGAMAEAASQSLARLLALDERVRAAVVKREFLLQNPKGFEELLRAAPPRFRQTMLLRSAARQPPSLRRFAARAVVEAKG